ncbi:MAG TPA: methionine--tRNA ligase [Planctomycetota bacterium]
MAKYLVTSALPYANGPLHFGHVAGAYLPADVYVRYLRMHGHEVLYVCGTDEYGVAITLRAEQQGVSYREYVDRWHGEICGLFDRLGVSFDVFSGTARCPYHVETAQRFFRVLVAGGWVQKRTEEQWYSPAMDRFLPDRYLVGTCHECGFEKARGDECPSCGTWIDSRRLGSPTSSLDGSKPVLRETTHWYLDLPALHRSGLSTWYRGGDDTRPHAAWKTNVDGHLAAMLKDLRERPITRDLPWGVPVPEEMEGSEGKVLYVWFDAPIGYVSATMEWAAAQGDVERWREWWQEPDTKLVHFIGKDNIAFHVLVFPAVLMGQGDAWEGKRFVLPWAVPANEFYNLQGRKFNTSEGWFLDLERFFERYDPDTTRFHLLLTAPETADSEFTWAGFQKTTNSMLADKLGNFASRVLKFCERRFENRVPAATGALDDHETLAAADRHFAEIGEFFSRHEFKRAAQALMAACNDLNQFFDLMAPWKLVKSEDATDQAACRNTLERCLAYLELLSRRFTPFCPSSAAKLRAMLGEAAAHVAAGSWGGENAENSPGRVPEGVPLGVAEVLFRKIDDETVAAEVEALHQAADAAG